METMKTMRMNFALALALALSPALGAQEKPAANAAGDSATAYRVQVVLGEYDGANKIASLPYTIPVAHAAGESRAAGNLRMGIRVPVPVAPKTTESAVQYVDVGTNLDVRVRRAEGERYAVDLTFERSSLYVRDKDKDGNVQGRAWAPGDPAPGNPPLIQTFRGNVQFLLHDGRAAETTAASDPVTGHVFKVEVVLSVLK